MYKVGDLVMIKTTFPSLQGFRGAVGLIEQIKDSVEYGECYYILIPGEKKSIIFNRNEFEIV
jgi:hypothetical protein